MAFSDEQLRKIEKFRRAVLPMYYSSNDETVFPISPGTQDSLILLQAGSKSKAVEYIKKLVDAEPSQRTKDYNELLGDVVQNQVQNGNNAVDELQQITGKFTEFLATFRDGKATAANITIQSGLQPILNAMVRRLGTIVDVEQNVKFHKNYSGFMQATYERDADAELKKELRSWIRVLVSYP
jgi:hypothetical protein